RSGNGARRPLAGINPVPDKIIGIGRLTIPSPFQQDLDPPDRTVLAQRSYPLEPALIPRIMPRMDHGPASVVTRIYISIRFDIKARKHHRRKTRRPDHRITAIVARVSAPAKKDRIRLGNLARSEQRKTNKKHEA